MDLVGARALGKITSFHSVQRTWIFRVGWEIIFWKSRVCWSGSKSMLITFLSLFLIFLLRGDNQSVNRVDVRGTSSRLPERNGSHRILL